MAPYRVLVVDDSAFMRKIVSDLVTADEQFEVVGTASNGLEAVEAIGKLAPDAVTMDLEMPVMNGLDALKQIMSKHSLPIIMLSGISEENTRDTIKALHSGAFDFIRKPAIDGSVDIEKVGEQLRDKLRIAVLVGRTRLKVHEQAPAPKLADRKRSGGKPAAAAEFGQLASRSGAGKRTSKQADEAVKETAASHGQADSLTAAKAGPLKKKGKPEAPERANPSEAAKTEQDLSPISLRASRKKTKPKGSQTFDTVVLIGTSTGGPRALHEVICSLPAAFEAPVLVVQHMPPNFTRSLAQRLDAFSEVRVTEAEQGERIETGTVYIAPGGYHMELAKDRAGYYAKLTEEEARSGHRPSVDVLFESAVPYQELKRHAVIMTGMGSDGAKGMKRLRESGALTTIAESEETCVVYGMPRSAVELGAATDVLPLTRISSFIAQAIAGHAH